MKILRASHLGMCFGVRDAIDLALGQPKPTTIFGDLVHNQTVLDHLHREGVKTVHQVAAISTPTIIITAHGASERTLKQFHERGLEVIEATCPLVHFAHATIQKLVREGYHPVVIGRRDHVEVRGLTEDFAEFDVVLCADDIENLRPRPRFGVIAQTTQPLERVKQLVELIRRKFPESELRFVDTVCQPTKQRQSAAIELARNSDVVVVIGGAHSNNTRELVETCSRHCERVHHVQCADDLQAEWFVGAEIVGVTAGTSTPDKAISEVETWLARLTGEPAVVKQTHETQFTL